MLDALLDRSVLFSFDRTGYARHARRFVAGDLDVDARGRVALVTGASSGLGIEIAQGLALRGMKVVMACRDVDKGERVRRGFGEAGSRAGVVRLDVSDLGAVRAFGAAWSGRLDVVVHNAGALSDREERTQDGLERTAATHLVGPFLLTHLLFPVMRASEDARLIHVASGGMYGTKLDVDRLFSPSQRSFDGVAQYALAKRAQVIVGEEIARRASASAPHISVSSMHPGWADTPGVRTALPRFYSLTQRILRTPAQGADTVLFLALAKRAAGARGQFFFDREAVSTHMNARTQETKAERAALWSACCERAGVPEGAFT